MRSASPGLAPALATVALLSACGGHSRSTPRATTPSPRPRETLTRPQALAFARAVNLTEADLPGFIPRSRHEHHTAGEARLEREMLRCAGPVGAGAGIAEVKSPSFELRRDVLDLSVSSEVGIARSAALAARELAAIRSPRVRACFTRYLESLARSERVRGATPGRVNIQTGTPPAPGAAGSFGWRITETFTVQHTGLPLYVDILGFVVGSARVTLVSSGALRPFPAVIQQRLFSLLLARAQAHAV
jgi:hypothetical protein